MKPKARLPKPVWIALLAAAVLFVISVVSSSYYTIGENTQAVVTTFGKPQLVSEAGLHFKMPFFQRVKLVNTSIKGFPIGYTVDNYGMTTTTQKESLMITKDYNFVNVDFYVSYQITDPIASLYAADDPEAVLKNMAQNCIRTVVSSYNVDSVLTTGKSEIQANVKEMLIGKLEKYDIGITLRDISIQDAEPPTEEVSNAFKAVETAKQGKDTAVNNANKYANEVLPAARANADMIIQDAEAKKAAKINEATGQAARFNSLYEEYTKYPLISKQRMFYETMEELLPDMRVIITGEGGAAQTVLPLDSFVYPGGTDSGAATENGGR